MLLRKPVACFSYIFSTINLLLFAYLKILGYARHFGHLFIVLIACLWIANYYSSSNQLIEKTRKNFNFNLIPIANFTSRFKDLFLIGLLLVHVLTAVYFYSFDLKYPFSQSRAVAQYIQTRQLNDLPIVGSEDIKISPLSAYLNRQIYFLERESFGSFIIWNNERQSLDELGLVKNLTHFLEQQSTDVLLVLNSDWTIKGDLSLIFANLNQFEIERLAQFNNSLVRNEGYTLYLISNKRGQTK